MPVGRLWRFAVMFAAAVVLALSGLVAGSLSAKDGPVLEPSAMIALADADPRRSHKGLFRMVVRSAARPGIITFLNSQADYRNPGDVTFSLSPSVAAGLAKQWGKPAHVALLGRTVTVEGALVRRPIVNVVNGRAQSFNRWGYQVRIERLSQIREISG